VAERPDKIVTLVDEATANAWVENKRFERAIILGPAVIAPAENVSFVRTTLSGIPESIFIEIPEGKPLQGVIGLRNVAFVDCRFQDIAIIGPAEAIKQFREGVDQRETPPPAQVAVGTQESSAD
jgi:hypothetical protein